MTDRRLDELFKMAGTTAPETSTKEVMGWIGKAAIAATATTGAIAGYKLLLTKKMIVMIMSSFTIVSIAVISVGIFQTPDSDQIPLVATIPAVYKTEPAVDIPADPEVTLTETAIIFSDENKNVQSEKVPAILPESTIDELTLVAPTPVGRTENVIQPGKLAPKEDTLKSVKNSREISVQPFSKLTIDGVFDVIIDQGNTEKVIVESDDENMVYAENDGANLTISSEEIKGKNNCKSGNQLVHITVKNISELTVSGIGNVTVKDLKVNNLKVFFSGVSDVVMQTTCSDFLLESSGIGNVSITGAADRAKINYTGVGDISANEFIVHDLELVASGIGNIFVYADKTISIIASGVGDITYRGNAQAKDIKFSGIGTLNSR